MMIYGFLIFYIFLKKIKYFLYENTLKKVIKMTNLLLIYKKHIVASGLVEMYGKNLIEAVRKRASNRQLKAFKYMQKKTKGLSF